MSSASMTEAASGPWLDHLDPFCCPACSGGLIGSAEALHCSGCGKDYPIRDGVLIIKDRIESNNQVAQEFYDSPLWPKFRFWEKFTWICNGGEKRARNQVLKHLPQQSGLKLLDVAVGDGVYLPWMPADWDIVGIDVTWSQLRDCLPRAAGRSVRLIQGEAEALPLRDAQFDAVLSIGAFNYFNDPEGSLREMVRVARPGAKIVVSDELPNLTDRMLGHKLGMPAIDRWIVSKLMHLGDRFTDMVERLSTFDVREVAGRVLPNFEYHEVWHGVGYVLVGRVPE
ncbi:MAG: methylase [Planctomycetes bacterium SCN 63-9]|nr:MAG: methylase [Planctomycetes bacterium SCN 63-9]